MKNIFGILLILILAGCGSSPAESGDDTISVAATTTLIGDVAKVIGGDHVNVIVLLPPGADPHGFDPRPQDIAAITDADAVLVNGFNLEESITPLLSNAKNVIEVSEGIEPLALGTEGIDPHVWQDPANVMIWSRNIAHALGVIDPIHAEAYQANADEYIAELKTLDAWIIAQVNQIPAEQRHLVTEHDTFGYFAKKYNFEIVGAIIPSASTGAAPSAQELAALEDAIRSLNVKAVFVGTTVNPSMAEQVARDTGTKLIPLYTDSLSSADGEASTYLDFMKYNVDAIVNALKP